MNKDIKKVILLLPTIAGLTACNIGGGSLLPQVITDPQAPTNTIPNGNQCLPSNLPVANGGSNANIKIAYSGNCQVADVTNPPIQSSLESMAIALTSYSGLRYCTGTPLSYNPATGVGYVLSAAHCVAGNPKAAGQGVTSSNIVTFSNNRNYVSQTLNAGSSGDITGTIQAIYIPSQYCQANEFISINGSYQCSNLPEQNGDLALIKVNFNRQGPNLNQQVKLATPSVNPASPSYIMALGYGITNTDSNNTNLFYITYEYYATNLYQGEAGQLTIMNGYSTYGANTYYSIICGGDSGGGDFYWSNNTWNLIGVHSYGSAVCGQASSSYAYSSIINPGANDISADVRPFSAQLQNIMATDTIAGGCNNNVAANNNFTCADN